jgi:PKD repeat protein
MMPRPPVSVLLVLIVASLLISCAAATGLALNDAHPPSPFIHPDAASLRAWTDDYEHAPAAPQASSARSRAVTTAPTAQSLLPLLDYVPAERDQGQSGTCWVWAGTGALELGHAAGYGVKDRLSVQWFDSNYNGGSGPDWAGMGGTLSDFVGFYDERRMAVPWSNTNASFADGYAVERALVPASLIGETPNYTLTAVEERRVQTRGVGRAQAIANVGAQLDQGRPVFVGLTFPNRDAVSDFLSVWYSGNESAVWDPSPYDGAPWDSANGAAHAVLCVGYDTTDSANPYWLLLNSMGTANGLRPSGTFRMAMDLDYDAVYAHDHPVYPSQWEVVDAAFALPVVPFPGQSAAPRDLDSDGVYEDVNGNGRPDFADIVLLFNHLSWCAAAEPVAAFDLNGNGRVDFADVVALFNRL